MTSEVTPAEAIEMGTATLYEASGGIDCDLDATIRPVWPGAVVCGPALPVRTDPGDNLPLHLAILEAQPGEVLVVDGGAAPHGYWGEVMTIAAMERGVAGLVIDGGVRDVAPIAALGFPVFSRHVAVRRTVKRTHGSVGKPITVGGVPVARGDLVVADGDGVLVIPAGAVAATVASGRERTTAEQGYFARLRNGETTVDIYNLLEKRD